MCNRYKTPQLERFSELMPGPLFPKWRPGIGPWGRGPFVRDRGAGRELVVGQWALIGDRDTRANSAPRMTNCARWESIATLRTFKGPWARKQRCIVPAEAFDYPNWESGRNVWWSFTRADGDLWALAGIYNDWTDPATGEVLPSYAMITQNCDGHPLLSRVHKHVDDLPDDQQDKRTVVPIEMTDIDVWLRGPVDEASDLVKLPPASLYVAGPTTASAPPGPGPVQASLI